ncbi:sigma-54-dependent transcriptional regulator [Calditrichota bacterium GD2]
MYRILIVDDDEYFLQSLKNLLVYKKYEVETCANPIMALDYLKKSTYHLAFLDVKMPGIDGLELLENIRGFNKDISVIMVSGQSTISIAVEAIKKGAFDFIEKPVDPEKLQITLKNALERQILYEEKSRLMAEIKSRYKIIGCSKAIDNVINTIEQVAALNAKVLITGETGTGKELVARAIHLTSNRSSGPFIKLNCAAIPTHLLESELFGHKKGAFTGATYEQLGKFQAANGGTLFLDEIGDMDLALQAKLLHVLQDNEFMMVGSNKYVKVDIRIIAATNQNLFQLIKEGKFREDLYHRLNVFNIKIPPLRERPEDIEPLARHFLREFADTYNKKIIDFTPQALDELKRYSWPGNVRELRNVIEKTVVFARGSLIGLEELQQQMSSPQPVKDALFCGTLKEELENCERKIIMKVLDQTNGKINEAAKILGINRTSLYKKKKRLGI